MNQRRFEASVLHVAESYAGGVRAAILDYVNSTPELSHSLLYATRPDAPIAPTDLARFSAAVEMPRGHVARIKSIRTAARNARVVHAHSSFGGAYSRLALSRTAKRIVYTPHCFAFERRDIGRASRITYRTIERILTRNTTVIAACSPREAELAHSLKRKSEVVFVPNLAPESFRPQVRRERRGRTGIHIVGAGRSSPQKDPMFFFRCVAALRAAGMSVTATWIGGDEVLKNSWADADIAVTGWMGRTDVVGELEKADLYIHTALWEGFPVAVLESIHLGVPTLVRRIPAFDGLDIPSFETPEELARLLTAPDLDRKLRAFAERASASVRSFDRPTQRSALLNCYLGEHHGQ